MIESSRNTNNNRKLQTYDSSLCLGFLEYLRQREGIKQMSDDWIRGSNRLKDAVGETLAQDIIDIGYRRLLAEISPDGTVIYKELNEYAKEIGTFNF
jgi:hypothetical protein